MYYFFKSMLYIAELFNIFVETFIVFFQNSDE